MKFMLNTEAFGINKLNRNKLIDAVSGDEGEINFLSNTDLLTIIVENEGYKWGVSDSREELEEIIEEFINGEIPEDAILSTQDFIDQTGNITLTDIETWCYKTGEKVEDIVKQIAPTLSVSEHLVAVGTEDLRVADYINTINEIIPNLTLLKERELQTQFILDKENFSINMCPKRIATLEDLNNLILRNIKIYEDIINHFDKDFLENIEGTDYENYTDKFFHRQFWNEIRLPIIEDYFNLFASLINKDKESKFILAFYDFEPNCLYFDTLEELEKFIKEVDCAPATVFEIKDGIEYELYSF